MLIQWLILTVETSSEMTSHKTCVCVCVCRGRSTVKLQSFTRSPTRNKSYPAPPSAPQNCAVRQTCPPFLCVPTFWRNFRAIGLRAKHVDRLTSTTCLCRSRVASFFAVGVGAYSLSAIFAARPPTSRFEPQPPRLVECYFRSAVGFRFRFRFYFSYIPES